MTYSVEVEHYDSQLGKCLNYLRLNGKEPQPSIVGLGYYDKLISQMEQEMNIKVHWLDGEARVWYKLEFKNENDFLVWLMRFS
jgi:hypothetical protein